jgi:hypothetical protein
MKHVRYYEEGLIVGFLFNEVVVEPPLLFQRAPLRI